MHGWLVESGRPTSRVLLALGAGLGTLTALLLHMALCARPVAPKRPTLVVLVVIDCLRADHVGCYGYQRATTPTIDRLAGDAVRFATAITAAGWTGESVPSILTGTYPRVHRCDEWKAPRNPDARTVAQLLQHEGFSAALFSDHEALGMVDVMDGFDHVVIGQMPELSAPQLTRRALDWIRDHRDRPAFVYLHYTGAHSPYDPPQPYWSLFLHDDLRFSLELPIDEDCANDAEPGTIPYTVVDRGITDAGHYAAVYDGEIAYADQQVGLLVEELEHMGLFEDSLLVVTADHGELLGEHQVWFDHVGCWESNIRVPLLVKYPQGRGRGTTDPRQVSLVDIAPTILELVGAKVPRIIQGKSLVPLLEDDRAVQHAFVYTTKEPHRSIRSLRWKLLFDGESLALYDLVKDPGETHDVSDVHPGKATELRTELERHEGHRLPWRATKTPPLSDDEQRALQNLGYLPLGEVGPDDATEPGNGH